MALRNLQPLLAPDPFDAFLVHQPAGIPQQRRDSPIPVTAILPRQGNDVPGQRNLVVGRSGDLALGRARLPQHPAGKPLRDAQLRHRMLYTIPPAGWA